LRKLNDEIPVKELVMRKIKSRSGLRNQKFITTGLVAATMAVTCVTLARGQGATEGDIALPQVRRDAAKELAMKIPERHLSRPFGTTISIEDNVGVIHVAQTGTND
jgi:hypothetical protein